MKNCDDWMDVPETYWITETHYRCKSCACEFSWHWAEGGEIIKFVNAVGQDERWLPTYGRHGYLDLLERLVPGFLRNREIDHGVAYKFGQTFTEMQGAVGTTDVYTIDERSPTCPTCNTRELDEISREVKVNLPIKWLDYRQFIELKD